MKRTITLIFIAFFSFLTLFGQTTKTMTWDGQEREYIEYVPASYQQGTPAPVLFCLHGLGDDMTNAFNTFGFKKIADDHGWILITPQALEAYVEKFGASIGAAWNSGISADASIIGGSGRIYINKDVDDSGFMMAILDNLIENYSIDEDNVFVTGFSMGGFMTNRLAIEHSDRIKAGASVSGTIGCDLLQDGKSQVAPISMMHIHGTADEMVTYNNGSLMYYMFELPISKGGAEATVEFWRNTNGCDPTPEVYQFEDIANDNLTFEKYTYKNGTNGTKTCFIKANNGKHTWYYTPANDIDYATEIYNFFASCMNETSVNNELTQQFEIVPNPSTGIFHINADNLKQANIYDMLGNKITERIDNTIDLTNYPSGIYLIEIISNNGTRQCRKIIVEK